MLPDWFNGTFILSTITLIGGGFSYLLIYCLKSRCSRVECCCIKCDREVLPPSALNQVELA